MNYEDLVAFLDEDLDEDRDIRMKKLAKKFFHIKQSPLHWVAISNAHPTFGMINHLIEC